MWKRYAVVILIILLVCQGAWASSVNITLSAAGDVVLGGDPRVKSGLGLTSEEFFASLIAKYGGGYPFQNVASYFRGDDVSIVNLECALTSAQPSRKKKHMLRSKPENAAMLTAAGIEVCNLANNHSKDFGVAGLRSTRLSLNRAAVKWCDFTTNGTYTVNKNGRSVKIGFAGFQTPTNQAKMKKRIKALKKRCDVVVASFHWCGTQEWTARVYPSDRRYAQAAIQAGADLVLGHHRHVPAGIEQYRGKYIVYDMGNFVVGIKHLLDATGRPLTDSMIFRWQFTIDDANKITAQSIRVIPCTTSTTSETYPVTDALGTMGAPVSNFRPGVLTGAKGKEVLDRIRAMSTVDIP